MSQTRVKNYEDGLRAPASRLWQFCGRYGLEATDLFAGLPYYVGGAAKPSLAAGVAGDGAAFDHEADAMMAAFTVATAALAPDERRLARAAVRGMATRKMRTP